MDFCEEEYDAFLADEVAAAAAMPPPPARTKPTTVPRTALSAASTQRAAVSNKRAVETTNRWDVEEDEASESESVGERSMRAQQSLSSASLRVPTVQRGVADNDERSGGAARRNTGDASSSSGKRRRRRSSRSDSLARPGGGVFRDRISSDDGSAGGNDPARSDAVRQQRGVVGAGDVGIARDAMRRAGVPDGEAAAFIEESVAEQSSTPRRYAVALTSLYDAGACPICEESASALHREAQMRIAGTAALRSAARAAQSHQEEVAQTIQARTAVTKQDLRKHDLIFKVEAELRSRMPDKRIAVYVMRMRRKIEREMEGAQVHYVPWTLQMVLDHFDIFKGHTRDAVRSAAYCHDLLMAQIPRIMQCMFVPSMTNPGATLLDVRASKELREMIKLHMATQQHLTNLQNAVDPTAVATQRALTAAINSYTCDELASTVTVDPEASAGVHTAGNAPLSAKSIYEINAL